MKCLLTYEDLKKNEKSYSLQGLRGLNPTLKHLQIFPYTKEHQNREAQKLAGKISIQGVQPKLSVQLALKDEVFKPVDKGGTFIVKPQTSMYPELPENEDLTMHLARIGGIDVPWHGLILCEDQSRSYVIKRFDRKGKGQKVAQEDFAQLMGATRITKYEASMEKVAEILEYCTFPTIEGAKLFQRIIFSFLVGNEDMHLKNFSLLTASNGKIQLTPAYDLLNSTIAMAQPEEELALSLKDKKRGLKRKDFVEYGKTDLFIPEKKLRKQVDEMLSFTSAWVKKIDASFLSLDMKRKYKELLRERTRRLSD